MVEIDWIIIVALLATLLAAAIYSQRFTRNVADFLVANRCAGRYVLAVSGGVAGLGAITIIAFWENVYSAGLTNTWWSMADGFVLALMMISGWVIYRFRQTRAMTLPQFIEMRYSRHFRLFTGVICWLSGVINFGIFPAVGARFFMGALQIPDDGLWAGIPVYPAMLVFLIGTAIVFTLLGGQIAVIVTDFIQGIFVSVMILVIVTYVVISVGIPAISHSLLSGISASDRGLIEHAISEGFGKDDPLASAISVIRDSATAKQDILVESVRAGYGGGSVREEQIDLALEHYRARDSMVNPMKISGKEDLNFWFYVMAAWMTFYAGRIWQGTQGFNSSATTPHELRMANILATFRGVPIALFTVVMPLCAFAFLNSPQFAGPAQAAHQYLGTIDNTNIARQMSTPLGLMAILPIGLKGCLVALMLAAFLGNLGAYMHSWGSIFVQDVVIPFRKTPLSTASHLLLLRGSIVGVCVFIFVFSLVFKQTEYIVMFWNITGAIFAGGAGVVVIGGLYWNRGTTCAAWAAMITGSTLATGSIVLRQVHVSDPLANPILAFLGSQNGMVLAFWSSVAAVFVYLVISLLQRRLFNLDQMLHRGKYAVAEDVIDADETQVRGWRALIGFTREFSRADKWVYSLAVAWMLLQVGVFIIGTIIGLVVGLDDSVWLAYWRVHLGAFYIISVITVVWFSIAGTRDLVDMFRRLASARRDNSDDGIVGNLQMQSDPQPQEVQVK